MGVPFTLQSGSIAERINDHHRVVFSLQQSPIEADFIYSFD
jgi:Txe/YoeB family toxin of Txe-Axe toxin-antitoxin module